MFDIPHLLTNLLNYFLDNQVFIKSRLGKQIDVASPALIFKIFESKNDLDASNITCSQLQKTLFATSYYKSYSYENKPMDRAAAIFNRNVLAALDSDIFSETEQVMVEATKKLFAGIIPIVELCTNNFINNDKNEACAIAYRSIFFFAIC